MDSATEDSHFRELDVLILDEDKIVTCSTAAYTLKIPIKVAKDVLSKYVDDRRRLKPNELTVTRTLSGLLLDGSLGVLWVKDEELAEKKAAFEKVTSEFINSVQKSKAIDLNVVSVLDYENKEEPLLGCVVGTNCVKRDIKVKRLPVPPPNPVKEKKSFFSNVKVAPKSESDKGKSTISNETVQPKVEPKTQPKIKNAGGITNFFSKAPPKSVSKTISTEENKDSVKASSESPITELHNEKENLPEENVKMEVDEDEPPNKSNNVLAPSENVKGKTNNKRKKKSKESDKPMKRRRRIQDTFDSDSSDDMFGGSEEDVIEKSFEEPVIVPPAKIEPPTPTKSKCKKAVTRTFLDEDGYCVTNTEYVFVSDQEEEKPSEQPSIVKKEESKEKKNSTTDSETDAKNKTKGKKNKKAPAANQPTLMNFFKKV